MLYLALKGLLSGAIVLLVSEVAKRSPALGALIVSLPLLVYRLAMLAWALLIAQALVGWLRFGWRAFSTGSTGGWRA